MERRREIRVEANEPVVVTELGANGITRWEEWFRTCQAAGC